MAIERASITVKNMTLKTEGPWSFPQDARCEKNAVIFLRKARNYKLNQLPKEHITGLIENGRCKVQCFSPSTGSRQARRTESMRTQIVRREFRCNDLNPRPAKNPELTLLLVLHDRLQPVPRSFGYQVLLVPEGRPWHQRACKIYSDGCPPMCVWYHCGATLQKNEELGFLKQRFRSLS